MKSSKRNVVGRRLELLSTEDLRRVTGGGLSGPDPCDGRYKIRCVQEITPPDTQDC